MFNAVSLREDGTRRKAERADKRVEANHHVGIRYVKPPLIVRCDKHGLGDKFVEWSTYIT